MLFRPEREWYRSELARQLGIPPSSLQRPLSRLREADVLADRRSGNRIYYRANTRSPVFQDLRAVLAKTSGLAWVMKEALDELAARITVAFVYGSIAAGEETSASDVDLFVLGEAGLSDLAPRLRQAAMRLGREVNPTTYSLVEFTKRFRSKDRFLHSVLEKPKLFVIGTDDDLRRASRPEESGRRANRSR